MLDIGGIMFAYKKVNKEKIQGMFEANVDNLSGVFDDYLEKHILNSTYYKMTYQKKEIGYFALHGESKITQFYLSDAYMHLGEGCFKNIVGAFKITRALVATCDMFFMGICMEFHKSIHVQGQCFKETQREVSPARYPKTMLRLANLSDTENIRRVSDDFLDDLYQAISDRLIYILEDEGMYGFGILNQNKIHKGTSSLSVFTVEGHRHKGVGRSIVLHLKDLVHTMGNVSVPGCIHDNYQVKRTLESCGYACDVRLLDIEF